MQRAGWEDLVAAVWVSWQRWRSYFGKVSLCFRRDVLLEGSEGGAEGVGMFFAMSKGYWI